MVFLPIFLSVIAVSSSFFVFFSCSFSFVFLFSFSFVFLFSFFFFLFSFFFFLFSFFFFLFSFFSFFFFFFMDYPHYPSTFGGHEGINDRMNGGMNDRGYERGYERRNGEGYERGNSESGGVGEGEWEEEERGKLLVKEQAYQSMRFFSFSFLSSGHVTILARDTLFFLFPCSSVVFSFVFSSFVRMLGSFRRKKCSFVANFFLFSFFLSFLFPLSPVGICQQNKLFKK